MRNTEIFGYSIKAGLAKAHNLGNVETKLGPRIDTLVAARFCSFVEETSELRNLRCLEAKFIDDARGGILKSEVNFLTEDGKTLNVWTGLSHKLKICPKGVGQPGKERASEIFADWLGGLEANEERFKRIVLTFPDEILSMYLEALLVVDINLFVWPSKSGESFQYSIIRTDDVEERTIARSEITFTKTSITDWNESNTIKVQNRTVGEFQVHSAQSRFVKFRFDIDGLHEVLQDKKRDNALIGRSLEYAMGRAANIHMPSMSVDTRLCNLLQAELRKNKWFVLLNVSKYCGDLEGGFRVGSKSPVDFISADGQTISVKSIKHRSGKICAPEVGQPSPKTFDYYFGDHGHYELPVDQTKFRLFVVDHTAIYLQKQAEWLFDCDYLFVMVDAAAPEFFCLTRSYLMKLSRRLAEAEFSFSVSRNDWLSAAKYSMTVYDGKEACGEVQLHKNRSSLKFRFHSSYLFSMA